MEMGRLQRPNQGYVLFAEWLTVTSHFETDRRDSSAARRVNGDPHRSAGGRDRGITTSALHNHSLPDAVSFMNFNRVRQPQWSRVSLIGSVGPVALILHLPEIAFEPDHDFAAGGGVRDRLHVDERLMG